MVVAQEEPSAYAKLLGRLDGQQFHCYVMSLPSTLGRSSGTSGTEGDRKPSGFIDLGKSKAISREHATIDWAPAERKYKITCLGKNGMVVGGKYTSRGGVASLGSRTPIKLGPAHLYFLLPESVDGGDGCASATSGQAASNGDAGPVVRPVSTMSGSSATETPRKEQPQPAASPLAGTFASQPPTATPVASATPATPAASATPATGSGAPETAASFDEMVDRAFSSPALSSVAAAGGLSSGDVQNWIMQNYPEWNEEGSKMRTLAVGIEGVLAKRYASSGADRWKEAVAPAAKRAKVSEDPQAVSAVMNTTPTPAAQLIAQPSSNGGVPSFPSPTGIVAASGGAGMVDEHSAAAAMRARQAVMPSVPSPKVVMARPGQPVVGAGIVGATAAAATGARAVSLVQGGGGGEEDGGGIDVGIEVG